MCVGGQFRDGERVRLLSTLLTKGVSISVMDRRAPLKVWEREVRLSVAAERRTEQSKQRLILINRQELPIAQRPTSWGEVETHDADF